MFELCAPLPIHECYLLAADGHKNRIQRIEFVHNGLVPRDLKL